MALTQEAIQERIDRFGKLYFVDDLIRLRGRDAEQLPILGYPVSDGVASEYEYFTGRRLDDMVDEACRALVRDGFKVNEGKTVALYAPSDLSFVVTFFALFRLGCKVLTISIRLGPPACANLLDRCGCTTILHGDTAWINATLAQLAADRPDVKLRPMLKRTAFDKPDAPPQPPFEREITDRDAEHTSVVLTMHSSGSTGLPKPLHLSHRSVANTLLAGTEWNAFNPLPWYHLHGLITSIQAMYHRKKAHLFGTQIPLTADNLISCLDAIQPEICHLVPYALKLVAEQQRGIDLLKRCRRVTGAGARTPDELGDRLIDEGVNFAVVFGLTEVGHMGDSVRRPADDTAWNYVRPYPHVLQHMLFKRLDDQTYESVYLKSHPALMTSNSDDPPGSFHSKDIFTPHPTIPDAWKYVARLDDRITLLSGEKILPMGMEDMIRKNVLVRDALIVGNDRLQPGLLVFRSQAAAHLSDQDLVKALWPDIAGANAIADQFARLTSDMVLPLGEDVEYPATDKKNIIRAAAYVKFAGQIDELYTRFGGAENGVGGPGAKLQLDVPGLEDYLLRVLKDEADLILPDAQADFFAGGVDSLRAAQIRRLLQKDLDLGHHPLPTNVVYDTGNVERLARLLFTLRTGETLTNGNSTKSEDGAITTMESLIRQYGTFESRVAGSNPEPDQAVVLLTGATGLLGAHVLHQLLNSPVVKHIYCLVRGEDPLSRIEASLRSRGLDFTSLQHCAKLTLLATSDLGQPSLGLPQDVYETLEQSTTHIIHLAWPVHFNLSLSSFAPQLAGLHNLLQLSLGVPHPNPARLVFTSSISTAFETPLPASIPESPILSLNYATATGYARSKLVGEHLCEAAAAVGGNAAVLRVGQITGDTVKGIWNDQEAVPMVVRSAQQLGVLPLVVGEADRCEFIPADTTASVCLELAGLVSEIVKNGVNGTNGTNGTTSHAMEKRAKADYYNVVPPHSFSWSEDLLPALQGAGLDFTPVAFGTWLEKLRTRGAELGSEAEAKLPALKLADYFEGAQGSGSSTRGLRFDIERAWAASPSLRQCPDVIKDGLVAKLVHSWLQSWS